MTPDETVTAFIARMEAKDVDGALELAADDIHYENVPVPPPYLGKEAVRGFLGPFLAGAAEVEWVVHRQTATGTIVMNEREDRFRFGETWVGIKVVGVFEVVDGAITLWRDYFDSKEMMDAFAAIG